MASLQPWSTANRRKTEQDQPKVEFFIHFFLTVSDFPDTELELCLIVFGFFFPEFMGVFQA